MIRIAVDLKIFDILVKSTDPMTAKELAEKTGADDILLGTSILIMFFFSDSLQDRANVLLISKPA